MVRPRQMFELQVGATSKTRAKGTLTADAVEQFLHENQIPVLFEDGGIHPMPFYVKWEVLKVTFDSRIPTRSRWRCDTGSR